MQDLGGRFERVALAPIDSDNEVVLPPGVELADVALVGSDRSSQGSLSKVCIEFIAKYEASDGYILWSTDRLTRVNRITLDGRILVEHDYRVQFTTFMSNVEDIAVARRPGYLSLQPDSWLIEGQGVIMLWAPTNDVVSH